MEQLVGLRIAQQLGLCSSGLGRAKRQRPELGAPSLRRRASALPLARSQASLAVAEQQAGASCTSSASSTPSDGAEGDGVCPCGPDYALGVIELPPRGSNTAARHCVGSQCVVPMSGYRERCAQDGKCYRLNPEHWSRFRHDLQEEPIPGHGRNTDRLQAGMRCEGCTDYRCEDALDRCLEIDNRCEGCRRGRCETSAEESDESEQILHRRPISKTARRKQRRLEESEDDDAGGCFGLLDGY